MNKKENKIYTKNIKISFDISEANFKKLKLFTEKEGRSVSNAINRIIEISKL